MQFLPTPRLQYRLWKLVGTVRYAADDWRWRAANGQQKNHVCFKACVVFLIIGKKV